MNKIGFVLFALTFATLIGLHPSAAEGALAVGTTGNVGADGIAIGDGFNYATRQDAIDRALAECHAQSSAPKATPSCQIVGTFARQCAAAALDPAAGTPGAGGAIAPTQQAANSQALANCQATAGANRRKFCKITQSDCDTHN
jgi:hypothetical protein